MTETREVEMARMVLPSGRREPIHFRAQRTAFVDLRCTFRHEDGLRCLQTAQPGSDRCALTGHPRTCTHPDTAKARHACGHCVAVAESANTTGPLPVATPACLSCPAPAVCTFCPYEED